MVPTIIHQTAPGDEALWHPIWTTCQNSWRAAYPEYTYMFWDDDDLDHLVREHFPEYLELYTLYPKNIYRIDFCRYLILYRHGGIYADMDYYCSRRFTHRLSSDKVSLVASPAPNETLQNSLMASPAGHEFWIHVLDNAAAFFYVNQDIILDPTARQHRRGQIVISATGPRLLDRVHASRPEQVHVLPVSEFNPRTSVGLPAPPYTRHYYTGKWGCRDHPTNRPITIDEPLP
ncbi:MAG: glycosyltransferase [Myxococcota bacterium]